MGGGALSGSDRDRVNGAEVLEKGRQAISFSVSGCIRSLLIFPVNLFQSLQVLDFFC